MKIVTSAFIPTGDVEVMVVPIEGQPGMYSVENAYSGEYQYFRKPLPDICKMQVKE
jgi:hypothetical protein